MTAATRRGGCALALVDDFAVDRGVVPGEGHRLAGLGEPRHVRLGRLHLLGGVPAPDVGEGPSSSRVSRASDRPGWADRMAAMSLARRAISSSRSAGSTL